MPIKATFIIPPSFDGKVPADRSAGCTRVVYPVPNIYELQSAAVLEQVGVSVRYFDFSGNSKREYCDFVENDDSDCYLLWVVNLSIKTDLEAIRHILTKRHVKYVLLLGPGATYFSDKCAIDEKVIVVRGEPENTLYELFPLINEGEDISDVDGITIVRNGIIHNNKAREAIKDLDVLPFPSRHLLGSRHFHNPKLKTGPYTAMITSRSCPYQCIYCVPSSLTFSKEIESRRLSGRKPLIGFRSVENVEKELDLLKTQGYKAVGFMDDNFIWNEKRTVELAQALSKRGFVWGCQARVDSITEPIAKVLGNTGCRYVDLGVESFNDDILKYINKNITVNQIYNAIDLLKRYKVPVKLNVLIGSSPLETKETVLHTLHEVKRLDVDQVMFNIVSPFPGTEYYDICKENGWLINGEYAPTDVQRESIVNLPNLSAKDMEQLLFWNNIRYYLSPTFIIKQLRRFDNITEFSSAFSAVRRKLFG